MAHRPYKRKFTGTQVAIHALMAGFASGLAIYVNTGSVLFGLLASLPGAWLGYALTNDIPHEDD